LTKLHFLVLDEHRLNLSLKIETFIQWRREVVAEGRAAPGDIISKGDTKRKKLINFVGKMVKYKFCG